MAESGRSQGCDWPAPDLAAPDNRQQRVSHFGGRLTHAQMRRHLSQSLSLQLKLLTPDRVVHWVEHPGPCEALVTYQV